MEPQHRLQIRQDHQATQPHEQRDHLRLYPLPRLPHRPSSLRLPCPLHRPVRPPPACQVSLPLPQRHLLAEPGGAAARDHGRSEVDNRPVHDQVHLPAS